MRKYSLIALLLVSVNSFAMSKQCEIANTMFEDAGLVMLDGMTMAVNEGEILSNSTVTHEEFSLWYTKIYPKKISTVANKYKRYINVDAKNPIYLGNVALIETNNLTASLNQYIKNKNEPNLDKVRDAKSRIESAYRRLVKDCGKKYDR
ncbi:hypothetical protein PTQ96_09310 [Serratia ureilytica]|uniref:hypothetical protein n=1 Tax=Serratia ureilytica TaxID=300181 RepID=UPI00313BD49E